MKTNINLKEISDILETKIRLRKTEENIDDIFSRFTQDNDRETLIKSMTSLIESDDNLVVLSSVLCTMIALEDQELEKYKDKIIKSLNEVFGIISNISITKDSYNLHCDISLQLNLSNHRIITLVYFLLLVQMRFYIFFRCYIYV